MKQISTLLSLLLVAGVFTTFSQTSILWEKSLGGSDNDLCYDVFPTPDGNYLVLGTTDSDDGLITDTEGQQDVWVVKIDIDGNVLWEQSYGGSLNDYAKGMVFSPDGEGYVIAGSTYSNDGDVSGNNGQRDAWVFKINTDGDLLWQECFGGDTIELLNGIIGTSDGGYLCIGNATSDNEDLTDNYGSNDLWVIKIQDDGDLDWQKNYGGTAGDFGFHATEGYDGYVIAGYSYSNDVDVSGHHGDVTTADYWVIKTDYSGNIDWQKSLGGDLTEYASNVLYTTGGNYLIAGNSFSDNGDVGGHYFSTTYSDIWLVELDEDGNIINEKNLGGSYDDEVNRIVYDLDGDFIIAGNSESGDEDLSGHYGSSDSPDFILMKVNSSYDVVWANNFGGINDDIGRNVYPYGFGYYIAVGYTKSISGDVSFHYGSGPNHDYWVVNFAPCEPEIFSEPIDISSCIGSSITLTASSSTGAFLYTWVFSGIEVSSTEPTITISPLTAEYNGDYYFIVEGDCGSDTSATATLTLSSLITPSISPTTPSDYCETGPILITCLTTDPDYSYQWLNDGVEISGATSTTYLAEGEGSFSVEISNSDGCTAVSDEVDISESFTTATVTISGSTNLCGGGTVGFSTVTGSLYTYQWFKDDSSISGATSSSYTASTVGVYHVVVAYGFCIVQSSDITVTNSSPESLITAAGDLDICETGSVTLNNASSGAGYAFQWLLNDVVISGAVGASFVASDTGFYSLVITTTAGCSDTSSSLHVINSCNTLTDKDFSSEVNIYPNPSNGLFSVSINYNTGEILFIAVVNTGGETVYETEIPSTGNRILNLSLLPAGAYTIRITGKQFTTHKNIIKTH
ncbi:MAG: T9SS type A sorting domain-containing protein [Chitinophagales bacterium]